MGSVRVMNHRDDGTTYIIQHSINTLDIESRTYTNVSCSRPIYLQEGRHLRVNPPLPPHLSSDSSARLQKLNVYLDHIPAISNPCILIKQNKQLSPHNDAPGKNNTHPHNIAPDSTTPPNNASPSNKQPKTPMPNAPSPPSSWLQTTKPHSSPPSPSPTSATPSANSPATQPATSPGPTWPAAR